MKIVTTKAFRAYLNHYLTCVLEETVYITRPGGKLLRLTPVPDRDVEDIKKIYGKKPDKLITEKE